MNLSLSLQHEYDIELTNKYYVTVGVYECSYDIITGDIYMFYNVMFSDMPSPMNQSTNVHFVNVKYEV